MSTATKRRPGFYTYDDFCVLTGEQKADLINGVIYMASPENIEAHDLYFWLGRLIADFLEETEAGGRLFGSRVAFRIDDRNSPEPDLAYVRPSRVHLIKRGQVDGAPDLAMEIVSPESVHRDYEIKFDLYQAAGVREYWIIDEMLKKVTLHRLDRRGVYRTVRPRAGVLNSQVIPGFWLRPEWLWQKPLPKKSKVLAEILA